METKRPSATNFGASFIHLFLKENVPNYCGEGFHFFMTHLCVRLCGLQIAVSVDDGRVGETAQVIGRIAAPGAQSSRVWSG